MGRPTPELRDLLRSHLVKARSAERAGDHAQTWVLLEDAHVLSQPWAVWHIRVHAAMLRVGLRRCDRREVVGQVVRLLVAGPGSLTGWYPVGNTGRASVSATLPMPVRADLADVLRRSGH
ncbi:DUF3703 domain-containing protein [Enhygromyxa salina]|uniref:DUF3703 domain-containing protein n=1 Tax=Enhygromyxa salina TaxID=215803 RepID=A0A2S9XNM6_9BACT|nr:DUF3703 domain-containing protein [Enhygromyxa salina]PRP94330.1 hypothetical protein ENSA7_78670 [Enhygromyxa salina]